MDVGRIIEILASHMQHRPAADRVDVVPDLQIVDIYAVRVDGGTDYIVHAGNGTIEEVSFVLWPPPQRGDSASASNENKRRDHMRIEQLMSRNVQFCAADDTLEQAARAMWDNDCGCVPVCSTNGSPHVVGMITDRDICMSALFGAKPLNELRVADAMSREVYVCRPSDSPTAVERLMRERQIRRIPVADESGRLLGIVSLADLARTGRRPTTDISETEVGETLAAICEPPAAVPH
jgi:CBS domain-containing protein